MIFSIKRILTTECPAFVAKVLQKCVFFFILKTLKPIQKNVHTIPVGVYIREKYQTFLTDCCFVFYLQRFVKIHDTTKESK